MDNQTPSKIMLHIEASFEAKHKSCEHLGPLVGHGVAWKFEHSKGPSQKPSQLVLNHLNILTAPHPISSLSVPLIYSYSWYVILIYFPKESYLDLGPENHLSSEPLLMGRTPRKLHFFVYVICQMLFVKFNVLFLQRFWCDVPNE